MDKLLEKIKITSYDILAVLLPGVAGLIALALGVILALGFSLAEEINMAAAYQWSTPAVFLGCIAVYFYGKIVEFIALSRHSWWRYPVYLMTRSMKLRRLVYGLRKLARGAGSRLKLQRDFTQSLRLLMLGRAVHLPKCSNDTEVSVYPRVASCLGFDRGIKDWGGVFRVSRSLVSESRSNSLVPIFQNKYGMYRALAASFAIAFWATIVLAVIGEIQGWCPTGGCLQAIGLALAYLILVRVFAASYLYNWRLFGDQVMAEALAYLHERNQKESESQ